MCAAVRRTPGSYAGAVAWTRWALVGIILYLLAGAASGLLGWRFGTWANWHPDGILVCGFLWGIFGAAVVRVQFSSIPTEGAGEATTLLGTLASWFLGVVDWTVQHAARRRLSLLDDAAL